MTRDWYPYPTAVDGYQGINPRGEMEWSGDCNGRNTNVRLQISSEDHAREIIEEIAEAIDKGYFD